MSATDSTEWKKTACIICALNCGLEVQTEGRRIVRIRGDKAHPISKGYVCEKSQRMDYYQNGADRLESPMRRKPDGTYEAIDWETAIREIAAKFSAIKARHGGESILYYGGGSQGNHLGGVYADSTIKALGIQYRSNALAQEKTGEAWVQGKMTGSGIHGDFEHCEVAVFVGKNPWQSHGFARTRVILREIQNDPARTLIVIDPRRSETAAMADIHLAVRPGTDAWCLAALAAIIVQQGLVARTWIDEHTTGYAPVADALQRIPVLHFAGICGVDEALLHRAAERIARAGSVSMIEDLGVQMNLHSTLVSYLNRLVWMLTGHYARQGTNNAFVPLLGLSRSKRERPKVQAAGIPEATAVVEKPWSRSPVTGSRVIMGLIPCNVIPEEILTDHPKRFRAMFVESANPVHSLADSQRMREAFRALELSVVIDVAMTETAAQADYVLPASSQFEKSRSHLFQPGIPAQRLPPATAAVRTAAGNAARSRDTCAARRGSWRTRRQSLSPAEARGGSWDDSLRTRVRMEVAARQAGRTLRACRAVPGTLATTTRRNGRRSGAVGRLPDVRSAESGAGGSRGFRWFATARWQRIVRCNRQLAIGRRVRGQRVRRELAGGPACRAAHQPSHTGTDA